MLRCGTRKCPLVIAILGQFDSTKTLVIVRTDTTSRPDKILFDRFYICMNALKQGFKNGCRKVIGLDGCFLKGVCRGQILAAVAKDGNGQMYPVAWAVVQVEYKDTWGWFLRVLREDLEMGNGEGFVLMTDL